MREVWLRLGNEAGVHTKRVNGKLSDRPIHSLKLYSSHRFLVRARYYSRPWRPEGQGMVPALRQRSVDKYTSSSATMRPVPACGSGHNGNSAEGCLSLSLGCRGEVRSESKLKDECELPGPKL